MLDSPVLALAQATSTGGAPACQSGSSGGRVTLWCLVPRSTRPGRLIPLPWRRRAAAPARRGKDDAMVHGSLLSLKSAADPARTSPIRRLKEAYGVDAISNTVHPRPRVVASDLRLCDCEGDRSPAPARVVPHGALRSLGATASSCSCSASGSFRPLRSAPWRRHRQGRRPVNLPPRVGVHHRRRRRVSACHRS